MKKKVKGSLLAGSLMALALAGCGGGGDDDAGASDLGTDGSSSDAATKYVGTWVESCNTSQAAWRLRLRRS